MARDFPVTTEQAEGGPRQVVIVSCGTCDVQAVLSAHWKGPDRADQISRYLRKRGWLVGRRPTGDRCPGCTREYRKLGKQSGHVPGDHRPFQTFILENRISDFEEERPMDAAVRKKIARDHGGKASSDHAGASPDVAPAADQPATPDRESRRLIHAEIDAVWLDDRKGYAGGVSDRSIADKLGIPVAWVAEVREFSFGPCMVNEDLEAFRKDLAAEMDFLRTIEAQQSSLAKQVDSAKSALAALARRAEPILKAVRP